MIILIQVLGLVCYILHSLDGAPTSIRQLENSIQTRLGISPKHHHDLNSTSINTTQRQRNTTSSSLISIVLSREEVSCIKRIPNKYGNLSDIQSGFQSCSSTNDATSTSNAISLYNSGDECINDITSIRPFQVSEAGPCATLVRSCLQDSHSSSSRTPELRFQSLTACLARGHRCRASIFQSTNSLERNLALIASFYFARLTYAFQGLQRCLVGEPYCLPNHEGCGANGRNMIASWYSFYSSAVESQLSSLELPDDTLVTTSDVLGLNNDQEAETIPRLSVPSAPSSSSNSRMSSAQQNQNNSSQVLHPRPSPFVKTVPKATRTRIRIKTIIQVPASSITPSLKIKTITFTTSNTIVSSTQHVLSPSPTHGSSSHAEVTSGSLPFLLPSPTLIIVQPTFSYSINNKPVNTQLPNHPQAVVAAIHSPASISLAAQVTPAASPVSQQPQTHSVSSHTSSPTPSSSKPNASKSNGDKIVIRFD